MIQLKEINKTYNNGAPLHVLKGIDLHIGKGEFVSIMGASGSGKSTLLNILGILDNYDTGEYYLNGTLIKNLGETKAAEYRNRMIGFIFQSFNLISFKNAMENVALPLFYQGVSRRKRNALAMEYLDRLGLKEWAHHMPNEMSGGQKQRVAIARALTTNPKVLLCDEATSALDPQTTASILALLKKLSKEMGITVIIITHEMSVIEEVCSRVAIIANHRIAEVGSVQEIFTHPKTDATRQLVYREEEDPVTYRPGEGRFLRVVYNGSNALEPIIAKMILDLKIPVNIIHANLRTIEGDTYGDMVIQLPDLVESERAMRYLLDRGISVEGVTQDA